MTTAPSTRPAGASAGSDSLRALYADWADIIATTPGLTTRLFRAIFDEWHQPTREPEDVTYREETVGGVPGIWAVPAGANTGEVLLYTHGGGFAVGSAASHRKLAGHVAKALGVTAFVLDYRRAPEHPHPAQVEDGVAVFTALLERGIAAGDVTTIGDSAGGNLAVAIPLALREQGRPLPGRVIAFSPWLDMENTGETLVTNADTDALVSVPLLEGMIAGVLADGRLRDFNELAGYRFATWCRGEATRWGGDTVLPCAANLPVEVGGVTVAPGDFVFADRSGAVVIPAPSVRDVLAEARRVQADDQRFLAEIRTEDPAALARGGHQSEQR